MTEGRRQRFALVIPALNEEEAIGSTLERALAARAEIIAQTSVGEVLVVFVNDGSTDNTQAVADRYQEVVKVRFESNRGYGAAIKAGFRATEAELVGFMDADGTCDPCFFVNLIQELEASQADVVVGSRMSAESEMPVLRRLGNVIFAKLIGAVSGQKLTDSASGMRVLRRSSLRYLHPLPNGLHFTPAMTSLILLDPRLHLSEVPMPYKERVGRSKLSVFRDGLRFLGIILFTTALFNPLKSLTALGFLFWLFGLGICGFAYLLGEQWPSLVALGAAFGVVFLQAVFVGFLSHQVLHMLLGPWRVAGLGESVLQRFFWTKRMVGTGVILLLIGLVVYAAAFSLPLSWRLPLVVQAALLVVAAGWIALAGVILRVIWAAKERKAAERGEPSATEEGT